MINLLSLAHRFMAARSEGHLLRLPRPGALPLPPAQHSQQLFPAMSSNPRPVLGWAPLPWPLLCGMIHEESPVKGHPLFTALWQLAQDLATSFWHDYCSQLLTPTGSHDSDLEDA